MEPLLQPRSTHPQPNLPFTLHLGKSVPSLGSVSWVRGQEAAEIVARDEGERQQVKGLRALALGLTAGPEPAPFLPDPP